MSEEWKNSEALVNPLPSQLLCAQELSCFWVVTSFLTEWVVAGLAPGSLAPPERVSPWFAEAKPKGNTSPPVYWQQHHRSCQMGNPTCNLQPGCAQPFLRHGWSK